MCEWNQRRSKLRWIFEKIELEDVDTSAEKEEKERVGKIRCVFSEKPGPSLTSIGDLGVTVGEIVYLATIFPNLVKVHDSLDSRKHRDRWFFSVAFSMEKTFIS